MKCEYCENEIQGVVSLCPFCGAAVAMSKDSGNSSTDMDNFQNAEQLQQVQREEKLKKEKELLQQQLELEREKAKLEQMRQTNTENANKSPCKRIIFMLLGIILGFWGIQFLYARRFISFAIILTCFVLSMIFSDSSIAPMEVLVMLVSFIASFVVSTDGKKRKMEWF